jgi:hypothetical protein
MLRLHDGETSLGLLERIGKIIGELLGRALIGVKTCERLRRRRLIERGVERVLAALDLDLGGARLGVGDLRGDCIDARAPLRDDLRRGGDVRLCIGNQPSV